VPPEGPKPEPKWFQWLSSEFGQESVFQGGTDYSKYDPISRRILNKLGENPYYGGRHGMNEIFKAANEENLINLADGQKDSPYTDDELVDKYWTDGLRQCELAAGPISRAEGGDYQETLGTVIGTCKRAAGMGRDKPPTVKRDHKDPVGTLRKFYLAAKRANEAARSRYGSSA
jgi:hypothetical protein